MNDFQYQLEPGSRKHICPSCGKRKFVRFIDKQTGHYMLSEYGRCDREDSCGYFKIPKGVSKQGFPIITAQPSINRRKTVMSNRSYIPGNILDQTCIDWQESSFVKNLLERIPYPFLLSDIEKVMALYRVGSVKNGYRKGAVTFPFIDENSNVHAIQVKLFDHANHTLATDAIHSIIEKHHKRKGTALPDWLSQYLQNEKKFTCLFGEHLLQKYPTNPIALVEAPKTAIVATLYFGLPDNPKNFLWLAVYNKSSLNAKKCWPLKNRIVVLFPDLGAYNDWEKKASIIESEFPNFHLKTSDFLETRAPDIEHKNGLDLADYLIKYDWRSFQQDLPQIQICEKSEKSVAEKKHFFFQEDLQAKAKKVIGEQNCLSKLQILKHLEDAAFESMLKDNIITSAIPLSDFYYLSYSTPF
ncbi:MAG: DUF6371 domain-containing protein [Bacteroidales bacterium]|nr:DUF6371 domain-containing protein [Bacteroidales bacterium]MCF8456411.1 DUF6371 domain-containing protein [Bacteroidales bacterium]